MVPFLFALVVMWILTNAASSEQRLSMDVAAVYIMPALDTETLFKTAMCMNTEWSISAAHTLSKRTRFLSINKMKAILRRISNVSDNADETTAKLFADCIKMRENTISKFEQDPETNPIRIALNPTNDEVEYHIFKIKESGSSCTCFLVSIDALIIERNAIATSFIKKTKERIITNIGSHPLIQVNGSNIVLFASFATKNKMHYYMRAEGAFTMESNQEIYGYDVRIYSDRGGHANLDSTAPITDVFAVTFDLLNHSNLTQDHQHRLHWIPENWNGCRLRTESMCKICVIQ